MSAADGYQSGDQCHGGGVNMTVEMTPQEAELLIAILRGAEDAFAGSNEALSLALADLRTWRSALLMAYMRERTAPSPATSATVAGLL